MVTKLIWLLRLSLAQPGALVDRRLPWRTFGLAAALCLLCLTNRRVDAGFQLDLSLNLQSINESQAIFLVQGTYTVTAPSNPTGTYVDQIRMSLVNVAPGLLQPAPSPYSRFSYDTNSGVYKWDGAIDIDTGQWVVSAAEILTPGNSVTLGRLLIDLSGLSPDSYVVSVFETDFTDGLGDFGNGPQSLEADEVGSVTAASIPLVVAAVPEPMTLGVLGLSMAALRLSKLRRRSS